MSGVTAGGGESKKQRQVCGVVKKQREVGGTVGGASNQSDA